MKTWKISTVNRINQSGTYCEDMFSFPCSNPVLKAQELDIFGKDYNIFESNKAIGRRWQT